MSDLIPFYIIDQRQTLHPFPTRRSSDLGALSRRGYEEGIAFNDLTEYLIVSRQSLDGVLKRLEREGHVKRIPHPDDGRARLILLTDQGRAYWESLQPRIHDFYAQGRSE